MLWYGSVRVLPNVKVGIGSSSLQAQQFGFGPFGSGSVLTLFVLSSVRIGSIWVRRFDVFNFSQ